MEILFQDNYEASFDALSFERKLVELVEELRLRRSLELESEKTLKSVMDEKYKAEMDLDELRRSYAREKAEFEQQITMLKRKLDDKLCVSDDEKAKQLVVTKTYSQEIRVLKEDLRSSHSEKLKLVKRIQELEGQLKLHNNFQETIVKQIGEMRNRSKVLAEECMELKKFQESLRGNVSEIHTNYSKFDVCYNHLRESVSLGEKRNETLKKEIIATKADVTVLKSMEMQVDETVQKKENIHELEEKIWSLQNLILFSRKENEKTLKNFAESNKHLCKYMNKYNDGQASEKALQLKIDKYEKDEEAWKMDMDEIQKELVRLKAENISLKEKLAEETGPPEVKLKNNDREVLSNDAGNSEDRANEESRPIINSHNETSNYELKEVEINVTEDAAQDMLKTVSSFCELATKRKFDAMEEEDNPKSLPFKKPNSTGDRRDWTSLLKNRPSMPNPLFVEEVSSSIEDISLSQDESQDIARGDVGNNMQGRETEMRDLANVQMNLRELKMNDADDKEKERVEEEDEKDDE